MDSRDLRNTPPRSPCEKMVGYVHLPRMLDKSRATLAGSQGEYVYPCPLDRRLLEFAGITAQQFSDAARTRTDQELAEWFRKTAARHSESEINAWNENMLRVGPDTEEKWGYFKATRDAIDPRRSDITAWADLLDLEEGRPVPKRNVSVSGGR
jgi:hypothetical protein